MLSVSIKHIEVLSTYSFSFETSRFQTFRPRIVRFHICSHVEETFKFQMKGWKASLWVLFTILSNEKSSVLLNVSEGYKQAAIIRFASSSAIFQAKALMPAKLLHHTWVLETQLTSIIDCTFSGNNMTHQRSGLPKWLRIMVYASLLYPFGWRRKRSAFDHVTAMETNVSLSTSI